MKGMLITALAAAAITIFILMASFPMGGGSYAGVIFIGPIPIIVASSPEVALI